MRKAILIYAVMVVALITRSAWAEEPYPAAPPPSATPANQRVALILTNWYTPQSYDRRYFDELLARIAGGKQVTSPDEPCIQWHAGKFPYLMEIGNTPYAAAYKVPGYEKVWDGYGIYELSKDGKTYVNVLEPSLTLSAATLGDAKVTPLRDLQNIRRGRLYGPDPRNGVDYLAGLYRIDQPNGIHDMREQDIAYYRRIMGMMGWPVDGKPELRPAWIHNINFVKDYLKTYFGDAVTSRVGAYATLEGIAQSGGDAAVSAAKEGYRNLLLAKTITDQSVTANEFWDRNMVFQGLCRAGYQVPDFDIQQIRQVGRTPEYNLVASKVVKGHIERIPKGSEVTIVYATYGALWPGSNPDAGPMSPPQPNTRNTYHENAFLNFRSLREYLEHQFDVAHGGAYRLNFSKSGGTGAVNSRTRTLFSYALTEHERLGSDDDPLRFSTVREDLERVIRLDGRKEIIIVLSHWEVASRDTAISIRELNQLPLNSIEEMKKEIFSISWCERYTGPGKFEQVREPAGGCPRDYARVQLTETFDDYMEDYSIGFANRIRGGVERYGIFPDLGMRIAARGPVTQAKGGVVMVKDGPLAGARLEVPADPRPGEPDGYTWAGAWRPASDPHPNMGPGAHRPINDYEKLSDYLDAAKDDFTAYIGTQAKADPKTALPTARRAMSPVVYVGPYRTLFNAPATVTLPYDARRVSDPSALMPLIYNEVTRDYEPVYPVPAGRPPRVDRANHTVSFDVQVLGNFVLVAQETTAAGATETGRELSSYRIPHVPAAGEAYYAPDNLHLITAAKDTDSLPNENGTPAGLTYTFTDTGEDIKRINDRGQDACSYYFPDQKRIVWTSTRDNIDMPRGNWSEITDYPKPAELYVSDLDGGNIVRLTNNKVYDAEVSVSPDGKWVVFGRQQEGDDDLWRIRPDGTGEQQITRTSDWQEGAPFYLPDSETILFRARKKTDQSKSPPPITVFSIRHDGTNLRQRTFDNDMNWAPYPAPDGRHYVFVRVIEGRNWEVFLGDLAGGEPVRLTYHEGFDGLPALSPDGKKMVFARAEPNKGGTWLNVMDVSSLKLGPENYKRVY